jgi:pimeloyl-ACP methyl ester carboxylesterase
MAKRVFVFLVSAFLITSAAFAEDKFFNSNGLRIRYVDEGSGPAVVLIHGNGGSLDGWRNAGFEDLARDYRVIALDVRGHGKSDKPHDPNAYGGEMRLDVIRLLDHLGINRAHIIGYSMGGSMTAALLTTHPHRFLTAVIAGAAGRMRPWTAEDDKLTEQEASEKETECVSRTQLYRLSPVNGPKPSEDQIKRLSAQCMANRDNDRFAQAALTRSRKGTVLTPSAVAAVNVPTLGVVGSSARFGRFSPSIRWRISGF